MPETTVEPTNTEKVLTTQDFKGNSRKPVSHGKGPQPDVPVLRKWTVEQIATAIRGGRSVIAIVREQTLRLKISQRLIRTLINKVGDTRSTVSEGINQFPVVWSQGREFSLALLTPEEQYQSNPTETDVVELIVPDDWK